MNRLNQSNIYLSHFINPGKLSSFATYTLSVLKFRRSLIVCLLLAGFNTCIAQNNYKRPIWRASVSLPGGKIKGELFSVSDSSLTIIGIDGKPDAIFFEEIKKIRLVKTSGRGIRRVMGFLGGSALGGWTFVTILTKGRTGEPRALGGIFGVIGGVIIGGPLGLILFPHIYNLITSKKFIVSQDSHSYRILKVELMKYSQTQ